ncbi:acyltransferase family protein [Streptomyces gobiensis]|uniref:acyltransferase family protein n=1 Tax=Streptomyces gobiensis TaxID=2875706 RepID=UPI001E4B845B|nr:hypothetical protein [Streptomyces gobiensis]UGY91828.1 hypothetical protein test1122_08920 [Streptomyces gobiensis]
MPKVPGKPDNKPRDPHWDNIRYFSGTLVVIGHSLESLSELNGLRWLHIASWALRVPVFVMVAGYFSSAGPLNAREARRLIESIALPYLLIGLLHTLQLKYYYGDWKFFTADPAWAMWFLLSLLAWRVLLPYLAALRYPLLTSVGAALAVGYIAKFSATFSASRTITFLPFFLLGWKLRQGLADELLRARWSRDAALGVLALTFAAGWVFRHDVSTTWLAMREPYGDEIPVGMEWAWAVRGAVLLCGMVIGLSFIRLVPKGRIPVITYLGAGGLYIYLLHPLALRPVMINGGVDWVRSWPEQLALVLLAAVLAAALASPPVRRLTRPLVQPRLPWLFAPAPAPPTTPVPTVPRQPQRAAEAGEPERVTFVR